MKDWLKDHLYYIVGSLLVVGFIIFIMIFSLNEKIPPPSVEEYAASLVRIILEDPYYEEHSYLASEIEELAFEYDGTDVGKELDKLLGKAEDLDDWIEKIIDRARDLNNALPEEYSVW